MVLLAQAQNLVTFFVALETLSIPLYILCATNLRRERSLESGLKYLIVGSLGSATLLYGMAFLYGGSGSTDFAGIAAGHRAGGIVGDPLVLIGIAMAAVGLAFKTSIAPFHQWTPDVYQGAPTPITAFMAVATKAAAFAVFVRFFDVALGPQADDWQPALAVLAAISIVVGNVGALGQDSLKRLLGYSGIAQAGYMLGGIVVASETGAQRARLLPRRLRLHEPRRLRGGRRPRARDRLRRRHPRGRRASARERPLLAWPLTISMLGPRRPAGDRGLHRQALPDRGAGRRRLHLARGLHRGRHDDLARLLPAGGRGDVDAARARRRAASDRGRRDARDRGRLTRSGRHSQGREPLRADRRLGPDLRCGDDRLRRRPLAADRLGLARGQLHGDNDLAAVIFGAGTRRRDTTSGPRSSTPCRT